MGSPPTAPGRVSREGPRHEVVISRPYLLKKTEVTVGEYREFLSSTGYKTGAQKKGMCLTGNGAKETPGASWSNPGFHQGEDHPVVCVNWFDALAYANWLSDQDGLSNCYRGSTWERGCKGYRLPTEAEWEYAARAGADTALASGALVELRCGVDPRLHAVGWYCGNSGRRTHSIARKNPNRWGLYDMHGNVWEWVWDVISRYPSTRVIDPTGPAMDSDDDRVVRGGGWGSDARLCRSAYRDGDEQKRSFDNLGFRLARSLPRE